MKTLKIRDTRIAEPRMSSARESIPEALQRYESLRPTYEGFSRHVRQMLTDKLRERAVRIHSIEARAKSAESVERKMLRMFEPKRSSCAVEDPLRCVTDLAAARVITFFPRTVSEIDAIIRERFFVLEKNNKSKMLQASGRFGYQSVHYLVELPPEEADRPDRENSGGSLPRFRSGRSSSTPGPRSSTTSSTSPTGLCRPPRAVAWRPWRAFWKSPTGSSRPSRTKTNATEGI